MNYHKENIAKIQKEIQTLVGLSEMEYAEKVFETGTDYIRQYLAYDNYADAIVLSKIYWNWWKLQWHIRDMAFLKIAAWKSHVQTTTYRDIYNRVHNVSDLVNEIYPNGYILKESYPEMINELMKAP